MATQSRLYKAFQNFLGLDLRSSDLLREKGAATAVKNMQYRDTGAMSKRKGWQHRIRTNQGSNAAAYTGLTTFNNVNVNTGAGTEEILGTGDHLYKKSTEDITITYSGSNVGTYEMTLDTSSGTFKFKLIEDGVAVSTFSLGTGRGASDTTITDLEALVDAVADWSMSTPVSVGSEKAAFLPIKDNVSVNGSGSTITVTYWEKVSQPHASSPNPFTNYLAQNGSTDFENISFADLNNVLYISNGYDALHKYDGSKVYKAGLPKGTIVSATGTHDGSGFDYDYKVTYEYTDAKGNVIEGVASDVTTDTQTAALGTSTITITVDNSTDLGPSTGYDIDSSDMKVHLWRTKNYNGGVAGLFYLVETKTNTSGVNLTFTDNTADTALGIQFVDPIKEHGLPPVGKYLTTWNNLLIISGKPNQSRTVFYSDTDSPEYFPSAANAFDVDKTVTGIGTLDKDLFVFKDHSISRVNGDFNTDNFTVSEASREGIGCAAHHTIQEVNSRLWFLSEEGVYAISNQGMEPVGKKVEPKFNKGNPYSLKQAIGFNWTKKDKYLLFLPNLTHTSGNRISSGDADSEILVYDYFRQSWLEWDNFNFMGGIATEGDDLYLLRRVTSLTAYPDTELSVLLQDGKESDYADHEAAITFSYATHWETLQDPSVWKKMLKIKMHALDASLNTFEGDTFTLTVKEQHNYSLDDISTLTIDFSGGAEGWGVGPWGEIPWGEARLLSAKNRLASKKVKAHRLTFENAVVHENILISGYELQVVTPYKIDMKE